MASSLDTLSNEVLRPLLAQNNLDITGGRDQLIERLATVSPAGVSTHDHSRTQSSDTTLEAAKRPRLKQSGSEEQSGSETNPGGSPELPEVTDQHGREQPAGGIVEDTTRQAQNDAQKGGVPGSVPRMDSTALAALISTIMDEKLKNLTPATTAQPIAPVLQSQPQLPLQQQLGDPQFAAGILYQQPSTSTQRPQQQFPQASPTSHVQSKTRQAIVRGEYVEFDSLLPENSCLDEGDHPGVSISFDGKQLNIPSPSRKKKTHIDSIDK